MSVRTVQAVTGLVVGFTCAEIRGAVVLQVIGTQPTGAAHAPQVTGLYRAVFCLIGSAAVEVVGEICAGVVVHRRALPVGCLK